MKHRHYDRRSFLGRLGLGCASIGATSLLSGITNMGLANAAALANQPFIPKANDYKALVCILLSGGNDSYNMLIPKGEKEYADYESARTNLSIPNADLLPITPIDSDGKTYGLHPNLQKMKTLFDDKNLAFVANVGTLIEPVTLSTFNRGGKLPLGLFSHSDQRNHWQTSLPQSRNVKGWGGRLADILCETNDCPSISMNISLDGINLFQQGNDINSYIVNYKDDGAVQLNQYDNGSFYQTLKRQTLDSLLETEYTNILNKAYTKTIVNSKSNSFEFNAALATGKSLNPTLENVNFNDDNLSLRLQMVAKTIAARSALNVNRQTFFVQLGGFDTHDDFLEDHGNLMTYLADGLSSFYEALGELGVENQVTTFTISDFARKLVSNGNGSDHAWGGNAIVMGGAVKGKQIYGQYPSLKLGNPLDAGTGRIIPTTSCDEYFAELALWLGASSSDLHHILPNIGNFWTPVSNNYPIGFMS